MQHLDRQLAVFRDRLCGEVGLKPEDAGKVATLVAADIRFLPVEAKEEIKAASPVPLSARFEELVAFQVWSDFATSIGSNPAITRASVVVQNYICFVYLKDACLRLLQSVRFLARSRRVPRSICRAAQCVTSATLSRTPIGVTTHRLLGLRVGFLRMHAIGLVQCVASRYRKRISISGKHCRVALRMRHTNNYAATKALQPTVLPPLRCSRTAAELGP